MLVYASRISFITGLNLLTAFAIVNVGFLVSRLHNGNRREEIQQTNCKAVLYSLCNINAT